MNILLKILVLHNNYPAQFKFILPALVSMGHNVIFLSLEYHGNVIPGIKHFKIKPNHDSAGPRFQKPYLGLSKLIANAEIFRAAFDRLKEEGFYPDFVLFHSGWGIGHFVKSIFPKCISAAYAEWWNSWDSEEINYDIDSPFSPPTNLPNKISLSYLNTLQSSALSEADFIWSPTRWQRQQYPLALQNKIEVIHEGVDINFFKRHELNARALPELNITYTSRALEPMRCFHHFVEVISRVMIDNKKLTLTIVGKDKPVYRELPKTSKPLGQLAKEKFSHMGIEDRVKWIDRLDSVSYKNLLTNSDVHIYYSRPFIASWSLLESMSSGCALVSNPSKMTSEFLENDSTFGSAALMTKCEDYGNSSNAISNFLDSPESRARCSQGARSIAEKFDHKKQVLKVFKMIGLP